MHPRLHQCGVGVGVGVGVGGLMLKLLGLRWIMSSRQEPLSLITESQLYSNTVANQVYV